MITDENIIELFFARSEQGIRELDTKYGKDFHNLPYDMVGKIVADLSVFYIQLSYALF